MTLLLINHTEHIATHSSSGDPLFFVLRAEPSSESGFVLTKWTITPPSTFGVCDDEKKMAIQVHTPQEDLKPFAMLITTLALAYLPRHTLWDWYLFVWFHC